MSTNTLLYLTELDEVGALTEGDNVKLVFGSEECRGVYLRAGEHRGSQIFGYTNGRSNAFRITVFSENMSVRDGSIVIRAGGHEPLTRDHPDRTIIHDYLGGGH
jgi:hypothetical protein